MVRQFWSLYAQNIDEIGLKLGMIIQAAKVLFLADPWDTLDHHLDSTLFLASHAQASGLECHWATPDDLFFQDGKGFASSQILAANARHSALHEARQTFDLNSFQSIHWRADPPVTLATMRLWALLGSTVKPGILFNSPKALLTWNEKYSCQRFSNWTIPTISSENPIKLKQFIERCAQSKIRVIAKPAGEAASRGVEVLPEGTDLAFARLQLIRESLGPWPLLQEFDSAITQGEVRLFILGNDIAGCLRKIPPRDNPVMIWEGSGPRPKIQVETPSRVQRERAQKIAQCLAQEGVLLSTIDFIDDRLLEINITSPGLLRFLPSEQGASLATRYWQMSHE